MTRSKLIWFPLLLLPLLTWCQNISFKQYKGNTHLPQSELRAITVLHDSTVLLYSSYRDMYIYDGYNVKVIDSLPDNRSEIEFTYHYSNATLIRDSNFRLYDGNEYQDIAPEFPVYPGVNLLNKNGVSILSKDFELYKFDEINKNWYSTGFIDSSFVALIEDSRHFELFEREDGQLVLQVQKLGSWEYYTIDETTSSPIPYSFSPRRIDFDIEQFTHISQDLITKYLPREKPLNGNSFEPALKHIIAIDKEDVPHLISIDQDNIVDKGIVALKSDNIFTLDRQNVYQATHSGLFQYHPNIKYYSPENSDMVPAVHTVIPDNNGNIWFCGFGTGFSLFDGKRIVHNSLDKKLQVLAGGFGDKRGSFFSTNEEEIGLVRIEGKKLHPDLLVKDGINYMSYLLKPYGEKGLAALLPKNGLGLVRNADKMSHTFDVIGPERGLWLKSPLGLGMENSGRIWLGGPKGLALYDDKMDKAKTWSAEDNSSVYNATTMTMDARGNLWYANDKNLYVIKNTLDIDLTNNDLSKFVDKVPIRLPAKSFNQFMDIVDNFLVLGNSEAVLFIDISNLTDISKMTYYQLNYGQEILGGGSEQNGILFDDNRRLWLIAQDGVNMIDWDNFSFDTTKNGIQWEDASSFKADKKTQRIVLPKDNRNCSIKIFPTHNWKLTKSIDYNHFLINSSNDTLFQKQGDQSGEVTIPYLPTDEYKLLTTAFKNGKAIDKIELPISVPKTLFEHNSVWVGLAMLLLGLGYFGLSVRKEFTEKEKIAKDELSRLRKEKESLMVNSIVSYFNPHFVNNSLHWAQSRYRKDQNMVTVLGRLSDNIRYILMHTKNGNSFHTLKEELKLVENYVKIQKIRFRDSFEFIMPEIDPNDSVLYINVFILQLQIYIENAIEHGHRNRAESKYIALKIERHAKHTNFIIEDDGIGRKKASKLISTGSGTGTKMLSDLRNIFNKRNEFPLTVRYEDDIFVDQQNKYFGTRVIISIPNEYNYTL